MGLGHRVSPETAPPSALEKEVPLPARAIAATGLLVLCLSAGALELRLNGKPLIPAPDPTIRAERLALPGGAIARGTSLGELYPLLAEAWRLELRGAAGTRVMELPDLAERLYSTYLVEAGGGWDLVLGRERVAGIEALELRGELLAEDDLELWLSWEGVNELKEEVARFCRDKGRRVKVLEVPNTLTKLLGVARAGGRLPDLVMIQSDYVTELAGGKLIQALDYLGTGELAAKGHESFAAQGKRWAIPIYYDAQLVFYNPRLAGGAPPVDWSLADLEARSRPLVGKVKAPMAWNLYSAYWLPPFMAGFGKERLVEADGSIRVDDAPTARALEALLALVSSGLLVPAERDAMISWFATGQAGFILSGSYSIPEFERLGLEFGVAAYPRATKGGRAVAPLLDFKGLAVSRRTEKPILARRLAQALTRQGFQRRFCAALGKLPANDLAWAASRGENRWYEPLARSAESGMVVPPGPAYPVFKNTMWKMLRLLFSGQTGVAETLSTAQRLIDENLKPRP